MSWLSALPIIGKVLSGPVEAIVDRLDEKDRRVFTQAMQAADQAYQLQLAQIQVNAAEAGHSSIFVAGWRPFIGWSCGVVLIGAAAVAIAGAVVGLNPEQIAALSEAREMMTPILFGLLGLGGMRSAEKWRGVARNRIN